MSDLLPILLYVFATFTLPVLDWFAHTVDWGNAQELITWIVAAVALWFARKAAIAAKETNDQQGRQIRALEDERRQRQEDERTSQARKISVWYVLVEEGAELRYWLLFSNASPLPASRVTVAISTKNGPVTFSKAITYIPPTGPGTTDNFGVASISATLNRHLPDIIQTGAGLPPDTVTVAFNDMNGFRWSRNLDGELIELHPDQSTKFHDRP